MTMAEIGDTKELQGLSELLADLKTLPDRIEKNVIRTALRRGVTEFGREVGSRMPLRTGRLARTVKMKSWKQDGKPVVTLMSGGGRAFYAHIVEAGSKPHIIKPRRAKFLFFGGSAKKVVNHPGTRGKFFIRDSFTQGSDNALRAFIAYLNQRLPKELRKQAKKSG